MSLSSQEVKMAVAFDLPVNLSTLGTGYLSENPIAGFLITLLAFFVLLAVVAVPISALFDIDIFPGLLPHARSLGSNVELSKAIETLTGSRAVEEFLNEPLDDFLKRVLGSRGARSSLTVGEVVARTGRALTPALSFLDYDNAFAAVQVPGEECRQLLMCEVHGQVTRLPALLQQAYAFLGPHMQHQDHYSRAILTGLSGGDCDLAFPDCSYSVLQMASFVPFLKRNNRL